MARCNVWMIRHLAHNSSSASDAPASRASRRAGKWSGLSGNPQDEHFRDERFDVMDATQLREPRDTAVTGKPNA
jgi:hypothetical protein